MGWKNNKDYEKNTEWRPLDRNLRWKVIRKIWFSSVNRENLLLITISSAIIAGLICLLATVAPNNWATDDYIFAFFIIIFNFIMIFITVILHLIPMTKTTIYIFRGKGYIGNAKVLNTEYDDGRACGREIVHRAYYELTIMMNKEGKNVQYELGYNNYCGDYKRDTVRWRGKDLKYDKEYVVVVTVDEKFFVLLE